MNIGRRDVVVPSHCTLYQLPIGSIRPRGWLADQLQRAIDGLGGHMDELEPDLLGKAFVTDFNAADLHDLVERVREVIMPGFDESTAASWLCEQSAQYWTGLIQLAYVTQDPALLAKAESWAERVLQRQRRDGYIGGYRSGDNLREDYNAWSTNWALRALLTYFEATDRQHVLQACHRGLIWFVDHWRDYYTDYVGPVLIESMIIVYLYTGDRRLLDWSNGCLRWLDANSRWYNTLSAFASPGFAYNSVHTVTYGECVKLPALIYAATGNQDYLQASVKGIDKILRHGFQRTGAPVSNFEYLSPPGATHATEYCNFATYANTFAWMARITGRAVYGDLLERIVFNGSQGARKKDEKAIAYLSSPNQVFATDKMRNFSTDWGSYAYAPVFYVACCPTQSVRLMPEFVRALCLEDQSGGLYLNAYAPCRIEAGDLSIEVATRYPFEDTVRLAVQAPGPVAKSLSLRIPGWCSRAAVSVNGSELPGEKQPASYLPIERTWRDGDTVEIRFDYPVTVSAVTCNAVTGAPPYAVERGPLLYALPIPEIWTPNPGRPVTPLPDGWHWYNVNPDESQPQIRIDHRSIRNDRFTYAYVLDPQTVADPECISVINEESDAYPWERSGIRLRVPMRRCRYLYPISSIHSLEIYENPAPADAETRWLEFVPYGCTNLRLSYFPVARGPDNLVAEAKS